MRKILALGVLLIAVSALSSGGDAKKDDFYEAQVQPILRQHCFRCHGDERVRNGFNVSTKETVLRGGEHGSPVKPGDPDGSLLIKAVRYQGDYRMPPKGKLDEKLVADLVEWIKRGAN